jgi:diguanylate cyclase (GGDEF)-like protein/PAS domain S-box-containing protein
MPRRGRDQPANDRGPRSPTFWGTRLSRFLMPSRARAEHYEQVRSVLDNMSQGLCMFDKSLRLVVCNQRYLDMYKLSPEIVKPGCTLRELIENRTASGLLQQDVDEYLKAILDANLAADTRKVVELPDGRSIQMTTQTFADGAWMSTHEDVTEQLKMADDARQANARLREAIDILPHGLVFLDAEGRYILWNQQYSDIYRRSADLFKPGARLAETLRIGVERGDYPEANGREEEWIAERLAKLHHPQGRHEQNLSDGRCILIDERRTSDGGIIGLRVDITEMKQREESVRLLFDSNPVPMLIYDRESHAIRAVNDAALSHYGYTRAQFLCMTLRHIHDCDTYAELAQIDPSSESHAGRTWKHIKANGQMIDVAIYVRAIAHENKPAMLMAAVDITERKRAEARVAHMAHHDALTGLPNRVLLRLKLEDALARIRRNGKNVATLCIDLDNFKSVNDALGHSHGDHLLQRVAERIRSVLREHDTAARLGGDEFAVVQTDVDDPADVSALARRLIADISEPFDVMGHQVVVGASIGIAIAPVDGEDADALLKNAELASYRAKAEGKGAFCFFETGMDARAQARRRLEMDLRAAMAADELEVHYQPLVNLASDTVSGFEALVRWRHPERGFVPPSEFIPVAEETGLIVPLGTYVLSKACRDAAHWPGDTKLAVNLSPLQFRTGSLFATVKRALEESGLPASRLELEITETVLLEKVDHIIATLHALRAIGVRISMDDFGTGYSSLSYLRKFPFDKIKIDRSFVHGLGSNADSRAIVRAILSLGASLGITITAEGVETEDELACLKAEGCNEGQGFLFSKARPQHEVLELLALKSVRAA